MAWSLIGQAVRHSYLLRLDKASFREVALDEPQELENRKRLAWICTFSNPLWIGPETLSSSVVVYIADRQISVRMGQSFWSRGPSLSTRFTANDFPSLRLSADAEHNYALVLQATIELTQLLHNVHDILYSSKERRMQMVCRGDYNRYLDDFRYSLSAWQDRWDDLKTSPKLNCTLRIVKEYVRLYACAFSFQSLLSRAVRDNRLGEMAPITTSEPKRPLSLFPHGIMSTAEGAYVLEAVDAARKILAIAGQTSPEAHIRYMPFRFYVYVSGYKDTDLNSTHGWLMMSIGTPCTQLSSYIRRTSLGPYYARNISKSPIWCNSSFTCSKKLPAATSILLAASQVCSNACGCRTGSVLLRGGLHLQTLWSI